MVVSRVREIVLAGLKEMDPMFLLAVLCAMFGAVLVVVILVVMISMRSDKAVKPVKVMNPPQIPTPEVIPPYTNAGGAPPHPAAAHPAEQAIPKPKPQPPQDNRMVMIEPERNQNYYYTIRLTNLQNREYTEMLFLTDIIVGSSPEESKFILSEDLSISKQHFKISAEKEQFMIEDLNSSNHTWLNGVQVVEKVPVKTGDSIKAGHYSYLVRLEKKMED